MTARSLWLRPESSGVASALLTAENCSGLCHVTIRKPAGIVVRGPLTSLCSRKRGWKRKEVFVGVTDGVRNASAAQTEITVVYFFVFVFPPSERTKPSVSPLPRFDISLCITASFGSEQPTKSFHRATIELKPLSIAFSLFDPPKSFSFFLFFCNQAFTHHEMGLGLMPGFDLN